MDPHFNVSIEDMGMVRRLVVAPEGHVTINIAIPCIGCPAVDLMQSDLREAVAAVPGVESVRVAIDWSSQWDRTEMSKAAIDKAQTHGYRI